MKRNFLLFAGVLAGAEELHDFLDRDEVGAPREGVLARRAGLTLEVSGTGLAVAQEPSPGAAPTASRCRITFAPPG